MQYHYKAADSSGKKIRGEINADSRTSAIEQIRQMDLLPISLAETHTSLNQENVPFWQKDIQFRSPEKQKIKKKVLFQYFNQMAIMLKAGVSLTTAMEIVIESERNKSFQIILKLVNQDLYNGIALSDAMSKFEAFPKICVNMIGAGELNGHLEVSFDRAAKMLDKEIQINAKVGNTMIYPTFLLVLVCILMVIMNILIIPKFTSIFAEFDSKLPAITLAVMAMSDGFRTYWYLILLFILLIFGAYHIAISKSERFLMKKDKIKLKLPGIGKVLKKSYVARFCRLLASLVEAGVDLVFAFDIAAGVIKNTFLQQSVHEISKEIRIGNVISGSMAKHPIFDPLLISMFRVGEESGAMGEALSDMADLYEEQTEEAIKGFTAMMEPMMTVIIGLVVGIMVISIVIPMFQMYSIIE